MQKVTLNTVYINYQVTNGVEKEFYGTLYKLMGGKKEVDEAYYTLEMKLYIESVERIHRARGNFDKLLKEQEKGVKTLEGLHSVILKEIENTKKCEQIDFYLKRFKQVLDYYVVTLKLKVKDNSDLCHFDNKYNYALLVDTAYITMGSITLNMNTLIEEMNTNFIRIFVSLKELMTKCDSSFKKQGVNPKEIQYNTMKKIEKDLIYMLENNLKFK